MSYNDFYLRVYPFRGSSNSRNKSSSSDWDQDAISVGKIFQNFKPDRSLTGQDIGVIIAKKSKQKFKTKLNLKFQFSNYAIL